MCQSWAFCQRQKKKKKKKRSLLTVGCHQCKSHAYGDFHSPPECRFKLSHFTGLQIYDFLDPRFQPKKILVTINM